MSPKPTQPAPPASGEPELYLRSVPVNPHDAAEQRAAGKAYAELVKAGRRALTCKPPMRGCP